MQFLRNHTHLRSHHQGRVAIIGNFDGVHLGCQAVVEQLLGKAVELGLLF